MGRTGEGSDNPQQRVGRGGLSEEVVPRHEGGQGGSHCRSGQVCRAVGTASTEAAMSLLHYRSRRELSLEQGELGESSGRQGWQESGHTDSSRPAWRGWASFLRAVGSHGRFEIGEYHDLILKTHYLLKTQRSNNIKPTF